LYIWQLVGLRRSARKHVSRGGRPFWAVVIRVLVVAAILAAVLTTYRDIGEVTQIVASDDENWRWAVDAEKQFREFSFYLAQLIFGWGAWVCFIVLVYSAIENPRRIHGNAWFAVAGVLLTGGAFVWWAYYYSRVPGTGGDVLPCLLVSPAIADWLAGSWMHVVIPAQRCEIIAKAKELVGVTAYSPMMMWAGIACFAAWILLSWAQARVERHDDMSQPPQPASSGQ
jgi:hypothetical protein